MADLTVNVDGLTFPNPFLIASGPPGTNANVIGRAFDEGWGGVVCKTICLEADKIINVSPRYARLRATGGTGFPARPSDARHISANGPVQTGKSAPPGEIIGWENIELISDRPFEVWLDEFRRIKDRYPDRPLIASIMEECHREKWVEIVQRCEETGVDGFELNLSCPHGLPERRMGQAMGQDPDIVREVCSWARAATRKPIWAKLTPNITRIADPGRAALEAGCDGLTAINTILCVMGVDLETLRPIPTVEGYSEAGGYSSKAIRPIAMRMVMELGRLIEEEFPYRSISGVGGIETGEDAAQFILLGANTVQICTGVMKHGYTIVERMIEELGAFMDRHDFRSIEEFRGHSLKFFATHAELVERQAAARATSVQGARASSPCARAGSPCSGAGNRDGQWEHQRLVAQSEELSDT